MSGPEKAGLSAEAWAKAERLRRLPVQCHARGVVPQPASSPRTPYVECDRRPRVPDDALYRCASLVEVRLQLRLQRGPIGPALQEASEARDHLPAVPLYLHHQRLQPPVSGVLGRRGQAATPDQLRRHEPADQQRQAAREQLLRHPGRRTLHASGPDPDPEGAPGLLLPDLHQRPSDHRHYGPPAARGGQRDTAHQRRGDRVDQRHAPRAKGRAEPYARGHPGQRPARADHRCGHQCLSEQHRRPRAGTVDRRADRDGCALLLVPHLPGRGARVEPAAGAEAGAGAEGPPVRHGHAEPETDRAHRRVLGRQG